MFRGLSTLGELNGESMLGLAGIALGIEIDFLVLCISVGCRIFCCPDDRSDARAGKGGGCSDI